MNNILNFLLPLLAPQIGRLVGPIKWNDMLVYAAAGRALEEGVREIRSDGKVKFGEVAQVAGEVALPILQKRFGPQNLDSDFHLDVVDDIGDEFRSDPTAQIGLNQRSRLTRLLAGAGDD